MKIKILALFFSLQFLLIGYANQVFADQTNFVRFGDLTIGAGDSVTNAVVLFGDLNVEGNIESDAVVVFGSLHLKQGGKITGDAVVVGGSLNYVSPSQITGEKVSVTLGGRSEGNPLEGVFKLAIFGIFLKYLGVLASKLFFLITSILLAFIFAKPLMLIGDTLSSSPWKCGFVGLLVWLCLPALILLLIITIVGIMLLPLIIPLIFIIVIFSIASMAALIGQQIKLKNASPAMQITLGALIIFLLSLIPFAYYFIFLVTVLLGTGAILFSKFGTTKPKFLG